MKQLNHKQMVIVDDILYKQTKHPNKPLHIFLTKRCRKWKNIYIYVYYTKNVTIL
jgi:hypothetical protein